MNIIRKAYQKIVPENIRHPIHNWRRTLVSDLKTSIVPLLDPTIRNLDSRLLDLKDVYRGERCFIMGNGPSLNKMDLNLFAEEHVWGFNRCYLLFERIDWRPSFYISVDTRVTPDNSEEINALFSLLPHAKFFFPLKFRMHEILKSAQNVYWYREKNLNDDNLPWSYFSTNPVEYVRAVRTVTIAGLQLAVYLGFNPIYLIGCDTDYKVPSTVEAEDDAERYLMSTADNDIDHFAPNYFGEGKKFHQPHPERMIFHYQQVKRICDEIGVDVYNATVGGKLEVFPRIDYDDLF